MSTPDTAAIRPFQIVFRNSTPVPTVSYESTLERAIEYAQARIAERQQFSARIYMVEGNEILWDSKVVSPAASPVPTIVAGAAVTAEPAEERSPNEYEIAGRLKKTETICEFILSCLADGKLQPVHLALIENWGDQQWSLIAQGAGVKMPSETTRAMVCKRVNANLMRMVAWSKAGAR